MTRICFFVFATFLCIKTFSQKAQEDKILSRYPEWGEGSIMLNNGTELKGALRFESKTGLLSYQNGDINKTLTSKSVVGFEFFDESINKQRVFYSFPYKDPKTDIIRNFFFEALKEFKGFAVLSKVDPVDIDQKFQNTYPAVNPVTGNPYVGGAAYPVTEVSQTETIYIMDAGGEIKPYIKITEKEIDRMVFDSSKTKNRMLNEYLLKKYTQPYYEKLAAYARENKLSFKRKTDLLTLLDYYKELVLGN